MAEKVTYQPKGGMCCKCIFAMNDCSWKDFSKMKPIKQDGDVVIVKCEDWEAH